VEVFMSLQALGQFWKKVDDDTAFKDEFFKAVPKELTSGAPVVAFAKGKGFEFTEKELGQAAASASTSKSELSDTQLEAVAGGGSITYSWKPASFGFLTDFNKLALKGKLGGLQT
jgi:predicted ribosomally synthesized peptide with nif11-like leader